MSRHDIVIRNFGVALTAGTLLLLSSCAARTSIGRIVYDPGRYQNREVHLRGRVTGGVNALVAGGYQLDDGTGRIIVMTAGPPPPKGADVSVTGRVQSGVTLLGRGIAVTLSERDRRVHY